MARLRSLGEYEKNENNEANGNKSVRRLPACMSSRSVKTGSQARWKPADRLISVCFVIFVFFVFSLHLFGRQHKCHYIITTFRRQPPMSPRGNHDILPAHGLISHWCGLPARG